MRMVVVTNHVVFFGYGGSFWPYETKAMYIPSASLAIGYLTGGGATMPKHTPDSYIVKVV
jgi:hypothetical protein